MICYCAVNTVHGILLWVWCRKFLDFFPQILCRLTKRISIWTCKWFHWSGEGWVVCCCVCFNFYEWRNLDAFKSKTQLLMAHANCYVNMTGFFSRHGVTFPTYPFNCAEIILRLTMKTTSSTPHVAAGGGKILSIWLLIYVFFFWIYTILESHWINLCCEKAFCVIGLST